MASKRLAEQAKPNDLKGMCRAINRMAGGKVEQRASELDSTVTSAVGSIVDSALDSVVSHFDSAITSTASVLSGATSDVQSGLDSAVSDINSNISVISNTLSAVSNMASANSVAINSVESTLSSVIVSTAASLVSHFDSAIASTETVLSDATSGVQSAVDSVETIASDAYSLASDTRSLVDANEALMNSFNGIFIETIDFLVSESAGTVTGSLEQTGGGELTQRFSDGYFNLDTDPALTVDLTPYVGTDAVPKSVYVYILQSSKGTIVASNSGWPATEHIKIATLTLQSAVATGLHGSLSNQNWNDHAQGTNSQGHITHIEERLRKEATHWESGVALSIKDAAGAELPTGNSSTAIELVTSVGVAYQMHDHVFPAIDMYVNADDDVHVTNQPVADGGAFFSTDDMVTDIVSLQDGTSIGVNKYFNLVVWGIQNKTGEPSHLMVNLPSGQYTVSAQAVSDADGFSIFTIPSQFKQIGFLVARLTFRIVGGSQWTYVAIEDLRGQAPNITAGVGVSTTDHSLLTNLANDDHPQYALDSALVSVTSVLSNATSAVQSGLDSAVSDLGSKITVTSDQASANSVAINSIASAVSDISNSLSAVSNFAQANSTAINSVESTLVSVIDSTAASLVSHFDSAIASTETVLSGATSDARSLASAGGGGGVTESHLDSTAASLVSHFDSAITSTEVVLSGATSDAYSLATAAPIGATTQTVNLLQADNTAAKQAKIDAVPRYIPTGEDVTFQFETSKTHTETAELLFRGFYGGGQLFIYGDITEADATALHTTQNTIIDSTTNAVHGIKVENCGIFTRIRNLKIIIQDANVSALIISRCNRPMDILYNYFAGDGKISVSNGLQGVNSFTLNVQRNYVSNTNYGFQANQTNIYSNGNDDTGTAPNYGLYANRLGTVGKNGTQPDGTIANELIARAGIILPYIDLTLTGSLYLGEQTTASGDVAGFGQLWTKDNSGTTELWFSNDAGVSTQIV